MELKSEINSIEEGNVDQTTKQAQEANKPAVEAMKAKYNEDQTELKIEFIEYVI